MAECIVEVCRIESVSKHPNADALELAIIKGWQCVVPIGKYKAGDLVTYIPIDSMIPLEHAERWGIAKYLSGISAEKQAGRVRCAKLRGEPSFGVVIERENADWVEGADVKDHYGIFKYVPELKLQSGDAETPHPLFPEYTDIENLRNYPNAFDEGETVFATEKIHGTNCRIGIIEGVEMAGSMSVRRKRPDDSEMERNTYWFPWTIPCVREMMEALARRGHQQIVLFGEVFGSKIQYLDYGAKNALGFRAFDILLDGKFMDSENFFGICENFHVPHVPCVYCGPFSLEAIRAASAGLTILQADHIREGVVVKPVVERTHPRIGRLAMKYIGDQYLFSKAADKDIADV